MARFCATLGIWIAVVTIGVMMVLADEPEDAIIISSSSTTSSPSSTSNSGKRRLGGVIKYKKVSVKLQQPSSSPDASGGETVVSFVQGGSNANNKTRKIKPKTSPQTMIYKPSKGNKINPASLADEEVTTTIRPVIVEELTSSTTTTSTTTKTTTSTTTTETPRTPRISFVSTTEEPEAFSPFAGFIRPTARVRVIKRPVNREQEEEDKPSSKYPVRTVTRVRVPGTTSTSTTTSTRRPSVKPSFRTTTTTSTTTEEPSRTTSQFIRLTRRPARNRTNQNRLVKLQIPFLATSTTTESASSLEDSIDDEPASARQPEEEQLQGEHSIRVNEDTEVHPSSSVPFRIRTTTTTTVAPIRLTTPEPPVAVISAVELPVPEEDETSSNRLQKYEDVKAKQLERLRNNNNRPVVRRPVQPTEAVEELPRARIVPSDSYEENLDLVDYFRPPQSNYGQRLTDFPKKQESSSNINNNDQKESVEGPKVVYTPPVYDYQPPAGYITGGYLPRIRVPAANHHDNKVRIPPVTYEPPHKEYEAPSPPPPPLRIYEPPTEDYRPPAQLLYQHDGYRRIPEEDRQQPESYARLVAVGSPAVNELPYPPAVDGPSYSSSASSEPSGPFRPSPENESQKDENAFQPAVYVSERPLDYRPYIISTQTPNAIEDEKPFVVRFQSKPEKPSPIVNQRVPFEPVETFRPHRVRLIERPSDNPDQRLIPIYDNQVNTRPQIRPYEPTEEPNRVILRPKEPSSNNNIPSRITVTHPPIYKPYEPHIIHREPVSTYRPHLAIEKPVTLTVKSRGEPITSNYRELSGPFYTTYEARPYHQVGSNHRAPPSSTGFYHQLSLESPFNNRETVPSWSVNPVNLRPFQSQQQQQRPKLETSDSYQYQYLRQNRSLEGPTKFDHQHNHYHSPPTSSSAGNDDYHQIDGAVRGTPGVDFPILQSIPDDLKFDCEIQESPGYYADLDTRCQVFHVCQTNRVKDSFLCPNGTIFNQKVRVCDWWHNVKCGESEAFYHINSDLGEQSSNYENYN